MMFQELQDKRDEDSWSGLGWTGHLEIIQSSCRDSLHYMRLLKASSNLHGSSTASPGNCVCQLGYTQGFCP